MTKDIVIICETHEQVEKIADWCEANGYPQCWHVPSTPQDREVVLYNTNGPRHHVAWPIAVHGRGRKVVTYAQLVGGGYL